ncbi:hypothetical protein Tco_1362164 [Tanacetum coccineum]
MYVVQVAQPQVYPDSTIAQVRYTLTKWYQEPNRRLSISEEALGAFGRSQTYSAEDTDTRGRGYDRRQEAEQKQVKIMKDRRDKVQAEYHVLELQPEEPLSELNTVEDRIMDSGASFHATYCKEELERFKLCSGKVRLADDKTLDIAVVRDVVLKTFFVRGNKRGSLYMVEVHPEGIGAIIDSSGSAALWFEEAEESFLHNVSKDKETGETAAGVANEIVMLKMVSETPLQFGVAERLSRTFRAESTGIRAEAPKMLWADSVSTVYLIYRIPYVSIGLRIPEEEWRGKDTSLTHFKYVTDSSSLMKPIQKSQVVLVDIPENLVENDSIVAEHGLSSEITQSPGGSSDTSEESENSRNFKDSGRSDKEYSKDGASSKGRLRDSTSLSSKEFVQWKKAINEEMVSLEKNQTCSLVKISVGKKASQRLWMFKVKEEQDGNKRYKTDSSTEAKAKLVQILISERSLSWLKILGKKSLVEMFTRLVMKDKLKYAQLQLASE